MEFRLLNRKELEAFLLSREWKEMPEIPISAQRGLSHINNPRAEEDDILLILLYHEGNLAGYLGLLPDRLFSGKESSRAAWMSCIWIDPEMRGKRIAQKLTEKGLEVWDKRLLLVNFTEAAKKVYDRTGAFEELASIQGVRGYMRSDLCHLLPNRKPGLKKIAWLLMLFDGLSNLFLDLRLKIMGKSFRYPEDSFVPASDFDDCKSLIEQYSQKSISRRSTAEHEWVINFPWLTKGLPDLYSKRYQFSSVADRFINSVYNIKNGKTVSGFITLLVHNNELKVPYSFFEKNQTESVFNFLIRFMISHKIHMLTVYNPELVLYMKSNKKPFFHLRNFTRNYLITKKLNDELPGIKEQLIFDGDGDAAFT